MREGVGNTIAETERFGVRIHGEVRDGTLTQPSGSTRESVVAGECSCLISGLAVPYAPVYFDNASNVYLKNYAVVSWSSSGVFSPSIYSKSLGASGVPFVAPSGRVWLVSAADTLWGYEASWSFDCSRFGLIGRGATSGAHSISVVNPVAGDADFASVVAVFHDASPDGRKRVYRLGGTDIDSPVFGWLEMVVTESSETAISITATLIRTRTQTAGSYASVPWFVTDHGTSVNATSPTLTITLSSSTPDNQHFEYDVSASGSWTVVPPDDGADNYTAGYEETLTGHVYSLNYDHAGDLIDTLLDVEVRSSTVRNSPSLTGASGSGSETWNVDNTPPGSNAWLATGGTLSFSASWVDTWTCFSETIHRFRRSGSAVLTIHNKASRTYSRTRAGEVQIRPHDGTYISSIPPSVMADVRELVSESATTAVLHEWHGVAPYTFNFPTTSSSDSGWVSDRTTGSIGVSIDGADQPGAGPVVGITSDPEQAILGQVYCMSSGTFLQVGGVVHACYTQPMRRTNALMSAPGAVRETANSSPVYAWDSSLIGRAGIVDVSTPSITATMVTSPYAYMTYATHYVSEQPATGDIIRGESSSQHVGWI